MDGAAEAGTDVSRSVHSADRLFELGEFFRMGAGRQEEFNPCGRNACVSRGFGNRGFGTERGSRLKRNEEQEICKAFGTARNSEPRTRNQGFNGPMHLTGQSSGPRPMGRDAGNLSTPVPVRFMVVLPGLVELPGPQNAISKSVVLAPRRTGRPLSGRPFSLTSVRERERWNTYPAPFASKPGLSFATPGRH